MGLFAANSDTHHVRLDFVSSYIKLESVHSFHLHALGVSEYLMKLTICVYVCMWFPLYSKLPDDASRYLLRPRRRCS